MWQGAEHRLACADGPVRRQLSVLAYLPLGAGNIAPSLLIAAMMIAVLGTFLMDLRHSTSAHAHRRRRRTVLDQSDVRADFLRLSSPAIIDLRFAVAKRSAIARATIRPKAESQITAREVEDVEERSTPSTPVIYEVVCRLGEEEMARPAVSLWWSGVAAGMSISFSLLAQAILLHAPARRAVAAARCRSRLFGRLRHGGACRGSSCSPRRQSPPYCRSWPTFNPGNLRKLARMWALVLLANFAGTLFAALFSYVYAGAHAGAEERHAGHQPANSWTLGWFEMFFKGIAPDFSSRQWSG